MNSDFGEPALESRWGTQRSGVLGGSCSWGHGYRHLPPPIDLDESLKPLIHQLMKYDRLRLRLEKLGGRLYHLKRIAEILEEKVVVKGRSTGFKVALADQKSLHSVLHDMGAGQYELQLDVRQLESLMPVYYICRICRAHQFEYDLIIEDLYQSPGYPLTDQRFVRLMQAGHEVFFLRLSQYRRRLGEQEPLCDPHRLRFKVDGILHHIGSYVFQAAWHEDQRAAVATAACLGMPNVDHAIELLYLCLSGELCELRGSVTGEMLSFFTDIYPQPAIHAFLAMLTRLDGGALADLHERALKLYTRLSRAFSTFLRMEVQWGYPALQVPVYKLIFGNFSRLDLVGDELKRNDCIKKAADCLEIESLEVIDDLLTLRPRGHMR